MTGNNKKRVLRPIGDSYIDLNEGNKMNKSDWIQVGDVPYIPNNKRITEIRRK